MFLKFILLFYCIVGNIYGYQEGEKIKNIKNVNEKANIELIYESLCPFSKQFYTGSFKEVVTELAKYLDVNPYPYGNAEIKVNENGEVKVTCQHGPKECYGNMLHACATFSLKNTTAAIIYNSCLMDPNQSNGMSDDSAADKCGELHGVDSTLIKSCAKSNEGIQLLQHNGQLSKKYYYEGVPFLLINGVWYGNNESNTKEFKTAICKVFKNPPLECSFVHAN